MVSCAFVGLASVATMTAVTTVAPANANATEVRVLLHEGPADPSDARGLRVALVDGSGPSRFLSLDETGGLLVQTGSTFEIVGHAGVWSSKGRGPWWVGSRRVRGRLEAWSDSGQIHVINRVELEDYVASTVGGEMMPSWPAEALRAQAVAARTYVLHEAGKRFESSWDVRATEISQVYLGLEGETQSTRSATEATAGQVLVHDGAPILAVFHSTAGGRTAGAGEVWGRDLPYLKGIEVEGEDDAPYTYWRAPKARVELETQARTMGFELGQIEAIDVGARTESGRVARLDLEGSRGRASLSGIPLRQFAASIGLRSTLFDVNITENGFSFVGSGHGHGVGMSQWGARAMAKRGASYREILETFYPGAAIAEALAEAHDLSQGRSQWTSQFRSEDDSSARSTSGAARSGWASVARGDE